MKTRLLSLFFLFGIFLLICPMVFAKIEISEPKDVYNFGDKLNFVVTILPSSVYGFFEVDLICGPEKINIYKIPANEEGFPANEKHSYSNYIPILKDTIGEMSGNCYVSASLGDEEADTKTFTITDEILIKTKLNKENYNPGDKAILTVEATKANGQLLDGFIEISGSDDLTQAIEKGIANIEFQISATRKAGTNVLIIAVYDRGENNKIRNQGTINTTYKVNQIPTSIDISLSSLELSPEEELAVGLDLFDQSKEKIYDTIYATVTSPKNVKKEISVKSGEITHVNFETTDTAGEWIINAEYKDISESKTFRLQEIQKIDFEFIDSILVIRNVGNSRYNQLIEITIGDQVETVELDLKIGEEKRFKLKAPQGEYSIVASDGSNIAEKSVLLTGNAISINELRTLNPFKNLMFIWVFIIILLALVGTWLLIRFRRRTVKLKDKFKGVELKEDKTPVLGSSPIIGKGNAESSIVLKGEKENSAVISLKVLNSETLKNNAKQELLKLLGTIKEKKGVVDFKGHYILIIFSPVVTRTFKNEIIATRVGFNLYKSLLEHNKKFMDKIEFNIGINSGDLVANIENGKLKYTGLGKTISLAKKLSDSNKSKILVSDNVRKKLLRAIDVKEIPSSDATKFFEIIQVKDQEANKERLADLLHRMDIEKIHDKKHDINGQKNQNSEKKE